MSDTRLTHVEIDGGAWSWTEDDGAWLTIGSERPGFGDWFELVDGEHGEGTAEHMFRMAQCLAEFAPALCGGRVTVGIERPSIWAVDPMGVELPFDWIDRADQIASHLPKEHA